MITAFLLLLPAAVCGQTQEWVFPVVVTGVIDKPLHFRTTFNILNLSAANAAGVIEVYDNKGVVRPGFFCTPVVVSPYRVSLASGGLFHQAGTTDVGLFDGWARLTVEGDVPVQSSAEIVLSKGEPKPCLLICSGPSTEVVSSAQVHAVRPSREFRAPATITETRESAYAIVNPSATETAKVTLQALKSNGDPFDGNTYTIPPRGRLSKFVWELLLLNKVFIVAPVRPTDFHGSVKITSDIPIAVGGLHVLFPEGKLVNLAISSTP
jgi:hypothetical protein